MSDQDRNPPASAWSHPLTPDERALSTGEAAETWSAFSQICAAATPPVNEARLLQTLRRRLNSEQSASPLAKNSASTWPAPVWFATAVALAAVLILAAAIAFWPNGEQQTVQPPTPPLPAPDAVTPEIEPVPEGAPVPEGSPTPELREAYASESPSTDQVAEVASEWEWEDASWDQDLDAMEQNLTAFRTTWAQGATASATLSAEMESFATELEAESL